MSKTLVINKSVDALENLAVTEEEYGFLETLKIISALVWLGLISELHTPLIETVWLRIWAAHYWISLEQHFYTSMW